MQICKQEVARFSAHGCQQCKQIFIYNIETRMMTTHNIVKTVFLGRMGYKEALKVQSSISRQILDNLDNKSNQKQENTLIFVEHNPVYTIGIRDKQYSAEDEAKLNKLGAEFYRTNRGGLITFHGHGQLVAYPILNLKDFTPSMRWFICAVEKTMIGVCQQLGLEARTTKDTGVWIGDRKVGAVGVHCRRYVTTHGVSLNCNTDLSWFQHIVPCGLEGKEVTSLSKEKGYTVTIQDTIPLFKESFKKQFNCSLTD